MNEFFVTCGTTISANALEQTYKSSACGNCRIVLL
jgi:hypothetical protein